jgi:hypothetical protein
VTTSPRRVTAALALLVAFRVALPLVVLAASGHALAPGFPVYEYDPRPGDAYGFYSAVRELLAAWGDEAPLLPAVALVACVAAILLTLRWRRDRERHAALVVALAWLAGIVAALLAAAVPENGAAVIGWPLVWSVPLLPYRGLGLPLDPDVAFGFGLALSLAASAATVVGTYVLGARAARSARIGLAAAALVAFWPLIVLVLGGIAGTRNGTWQIELGLSLYTEPASTALVVVALALVVRERPRPVDAALAGALAGFSVAVRLSNVLIVACIVVWLLVRRRSLAAWAAGAAAAFAPLVLAYYPKGYASLAPPIFPEHPFALDYARPAWSETLLWRPLVLLALLPLAAIGTLRLPRRTAAFLWANVLVTAAFYTFYELTPLHPRFLFVVLPVVLVLWAAGAALVAAAAATRFGRDDARPR